MNKKVDSRTWTIAEAGAALAAKAGATFVTLFKQGTLEVEIYRPVGVDRQQPHDHVHRPRTRRRCRRSRSPGAHLHLTDYDSEEFVFLLIQ